MEPFTVIQRVLSELLDMPPGQIHERSYVVRELGAESIDLLELAVHLSGAFRLELDEREAYLLDLRAGLAEARAGGRDLADHLAARFPHLPAARRAEILADLGDGPVLQVGDIVCYLQHLRPGRGGQPA